MEQTNLISKEIYKDKIKLKLRRFVIIIKLKIRFI
jgi:hypothetical protein